MKAKQPICLLILIVQLFMMPAAFAETVSGPDPERVEAFMQEQQRLETEYGLSTEFWTVEDLFHFYSEYDDVVNFPGYGGPHHSLPKDGEITQDEARELAIAAARSKHGDDAFETGFEWAEIVSFQERKDGVRFWSFIFMNPAQGIPLGYGYEVELDASTGEVLHFADDETGWG